MTPATANGGTDHRAPFILVLMPDHVPDCRLLIDAIKQAIPGETVITFETPGRVVQLLGEGYRPRVLFVDVGARQDVTEMLGDVRRVVPEMPVIALSDNLSAPVRGADETVVKSMREGIGGFASRLQGALVVAVGQAHGTGLRELLRQFAEMG